MSENESSAGLVSMPTLQYNEEGWGPHEISEDFRVMPYQVIATPFSIIVKHHSEGKLLKYQCENMNISTKLIWFSRIQIVIDKVPQLKQQIVNEKIIFKYG